MNVFHTPETTMTPEEAEAVVRRHLERVPEAPSGPSVSDVAEALRLSPEEVARLLQEVRTERTRTVRRNVQPRERRLWLMSGIIAVALLGTGLGVAKAFHLGPFQVYNYEPPAPLQNRYDVFIDGQERGMFAYDSSQDGPPSAEIPARLKTWFESSEPTFRDPGVTTGEADARRAADAIKAGKWDQVPGLRIASVEVRRPNPNGLALRWIRATVPIYGGDDALVADAVIRERSRRIDEAVKIALKGLPPPSSP